MTHLRHPAALAHDSPFWMVFCPGTDQYYNSHPAVCHETQESAQQEARRLAVKTGRPAYVLRAVEKETPVAETITTAL